MGRRGAMFVQSQPMDGGITNSNLEKWYLDKHIPEVLNTGGVRGVLFCQLNRESSKNYTGESQPKPYLAVYLLPDLDWLHEEGCGLWKLQLVLGSDDANLENKHKGRSVFEVAEFVTHFWKVVDFTHEGTAPQLTDAAPGDDTVAKEPTKRVVLLYSDNLSWDSFSAENSDLRPSPAPRQKTPLVISTQFKIDETRPGPPSSEGGEGGAPMALPETRYLEFYQFCGHGPDMPLIEPEIRSRTLEYTVLAEFGDTKGLTIRQ